MLSVIHSNMLSKLLLEVIPFSLHPCLFFTFLLYIPIIAPCFTSVELHTLLYVVRIIFLIFTDSIWASFGKSSGSTAFRLWSCLIADSSSYLVISTHLSPAPLLCYCIYSVFYLFSMLSVKVPLLVQDIY